MSRALLASLLVLVLAGPVRGEEPPVKGAAPGTSAAGKTTPTRSAASVTALRVGGISRVVRARGRIATFYVRQATLDGFAIHASAKPRDGALLEAAWIIKNMLARRPDVLKTLRWRGIRCCVMAHNEYTTSLPEHRALTPGKWWDFRARGLGPGPKRPIVSCAEENLLAFPGDTYAGESILIHEFAHAVDLEALRYLDRSFAGRLEATYKAALAEGLWKDCYAATNKEEYWAEGVQTWFDANRAPGPQHNDVNNREELTAYDPRLAALIAKAFGNNPWRYVPVAQRAGQEHLKSHDPAKAPRFAWPKGLADWYWAYEKKKASGAGREVLEALPAASRPRRSPTTHSETHILFMNRTSQDLRVFWLGYDGKRRPYGTVRAGKNIERATLVYHVWVVTTDAGHEVARFQAGRKAGRAVITQSDLKPGARPARRGR